MRPGTRLTVRLLLQGICLCLALQLLGCQPGKRQDPTPLIDIVATTGMVGDLVRSIGGARVAVTTLMGPGVDPHLYKATQGDLEAIASAEVIFYNGLHLEGKMATLFENMAQRKPCFAVSEDIDRKKLRAPLEFAGSYDPHIWFDVLLWSEALGTVSRRLATLYPQFREEFLAREAKKLAQLKELDDWVRAKIGSIPRDRRVLVTAHDAFGYLGMAYDLDVVGLQGVSTALEFGLRDIARVSDLVIQRRVRSVFIEASVPERLVKALVEGVAARGHQVQIGGSLFSDSLGAEGTPEGTYEGMVRHNIATIVEGLR